jgi:hypothetical protein
LFRGFDDFGGGFQKVRLLYWTDASGFLLAYELLKAAGFDSFRQG